MFGAVHSPWLRGTVRLLCGALVLAVACDPVALNQSPTPMKRATSRYDADPGPTQTGAEPRKLTVEFGKPGAILLASTFGLLLSDQQDIEEWLVAHAVYPFDVDGKIVANDDQALTKAVSGYKEVWRRQVKDQTQCDATTRDEILTGAPFHYLDRRGKRAPRDELVRDLDTLGLGPADLLVNCHADGVAGYSVIVVNQAGKAGIRAFRN